MERAPGQFVLLPLAIREAAGLNPFSSPCPKSQRAVFDAPLGRWWSQTSLSDSSGSIHDERRSRDGHDRLSTSVESVLIEYMKDLLTRRGFSHGGLYSVGHA